MNTDGQRRLELAATLVRRLVALIVGLAMAVELGFVLVLLAVKGEPWALIVVSGICTFGALVAVAASERLRRRLLLPPVDGFLTGLVDAFRGLRHENAGDLPRPLRWLIAGLTALGLLLLADCLFSSEPVVFARQLWAPFRLRRAEAAGLRAALAVLAGVELLALVTIVPQLRQRSATAWLLALVLAGIAGVVGAATLAHPGLRAVAELWPGEFLTPLGLLRGAWRPALAGGVFVVLLRHRHTFCRGGWDDLPPWPAPDAPLRRRRRVRAGLVALIALGVMGLGYLSAYRLDLERELPARHWWRVRYILRWDLRLIGLLDGNRVDLVGGAAETCDLERVRVLLPYCLRANRVTGEAAWMVEWEPAATIRGRHAEVLEYLLARNLDRIGNAGFYALAEAIRYHQTQTFMRLRARGARLDGLPREPDYLLWVAADAGDVGMIKYLQTNGLTLASSSSGTTPLHRAARGGDLATMKYLVGAGGDPLAVNKYGSTVLHYYAHRPSDSARPETKLARAEVVDYLLSLGLDLNAKDENGKTAWDLAVDQGREGLRAILEARGATVTPPPPPAPDDDDAEDGEE